MLSSLISWKKKLYILSFFAIFIIIFLYPNSSKAQKMLFTEEQQQIENQNQTQLFKEPEQDGVYVVDNLGNYHKLISISKAAVKEIEKSEYMYIRIKYFNITINPQEVNHVSWNNFKGFFFKGKQFIQKIKIINKVKHMPLGVGKVFAFLAGMPGGDQYDLYPLVDYASYMRCERKLDSSYCEFKDRELIKKYLGDGRIPFCLSIKVGVLSELGEQFYIVCFKE